MVLAAFALSACGNATTTLSPAPATAPPGTTPSPGASPTPTARPTATPSATPSATPTGMPTSTLKAGYDRPGTVMLPAGLTTAGTGALVATDSLSAVPVAANGSFTIGTFTSDAQLVSVGNAKGTPLLAGWLGASEPVIDAHTTAEVYLYFATFVYTIDSATQRAEVMASISSLPGLSSVESAISSALIAHPASSPGNDAGVQSAIASLVSALRSSSAMNLRAGRGLNAIARILSTRRPDVLAIMPGTTASGITIIQGTNDSITFQNTLRREAAAFIDEVSHVNSAGTTISDQPVDTNKPLPIAPVTGIGSFLGSISDYLNGAYALVPTVSEPVDTPNLPGAKSTLYRVAIVGPGHSPGDYAMLTDVEKEKLVEENTSTLVFEIVLPLFASVIVPNAKIGALENSTANALVQDVIATVATDAKVKAAAESGDPVAVFDIATADILQSTTLTEKLCEYIVEVLETNTLVSQASNDAILLAGKVAPIIRVADGGIAIADAATIIYDEGQANLGDIFMITATDSKTTLTANPATIVGPGTSTLTTAVHPPEENPLIYKYATQGAFGTLTDASGNPDHVNNFTSSYATVTYTAGSNGPGTDTITVTPIVHVVGQPDVDLTSATATVTVQPSATPTPIANDCTTAGELYVFSSAVTCQDVVSGKLPSPMSVTGNGFSAQLQFVNPWNYTTVPLAFQAGTGSPYDISAGPPSSPFQPFCTASSDSNPNVNVGCRYLSINVPTTASGFGGSVGANVVLTQTGTTLWDPNNPNEYYNCFLWLFDGGAYYMKAVGAIDPKNPTTMTVSFGSNDLQTGYYSKSNQAVYAVSCGNNNIGSVRRRPSR